MTLAEYLATHSCKGFVPKVCYSPIGDFLWLYWRNEHAVAEPHDGFTLERSVATGEVVGVKIYDVSQLLVRDAL